MTTEEIDQLTGRDLDRQIAQVVFGHPIQDMAVYESFEDGSWQVCPLCQRQDPDFPCNITDGQFGHQIGPCMGLGDEPYWVVVPFYSTDIAAAWQVVEKLAERNLLLQLERMENGKWCAFFWTPDGGSTAASIDPTAPLAICRAALRAFAQQEK